MAFIWGGLASFGAFAFFTTEARRHGFVGESSKGASGKSNTGLFSVTIEAPAWRGTGAVGWPVIKHVKVPRGKVK